MIRNGLNPSIFLWTLWSVTIIMLFLRFFGVITISYLWILAPISLLVIALLCVAAFAKLGYIISVWIINMRRR